MAGSKAHGQASPSETGRVAESVLCQLGGIPDGNASGNLADPGRLWPPCEPPLSAARRERFVAAFSAAGIRNSGSDRVGWLGMASVASYLHQLRPTCIGAVALAALAMTPHDHVVPSAKRGVAIEAGGRATAMMLRARPNVTDDAIVIDLAVIRPAPHPDARPWPLGMVIAPPPINDPIVLWDGSPLDSCCQHWSRRSACSPPNAPRACYRASDVYRRFARAV